ncbi:MAG: sterol desaturase family protein [Rhodospirillaceae bacterium]|nr:sterol desaturase family protein [Rhodospirillaceae bacterium]MBT5194464.1 sterol desaturase family protein [Rhodospirillaceae bacterium]MBT5895268.1 sterol desaturase family protein [Rhodospirillaceae bacterium]MBT6426359.1 sterol desaturase family protein [Rhodospirillaceae bacterium]
MTDAALDERDDRGNWRPAEPIALAPINAWPPRPVAVLKWLFGFPGYIWPYHLFWLGVTLVTWAYLTPDLATMKTLELWWIALIHGRNLALIAFLFGGLHLYFHILRRQGDDRRYTTRPFPTDSGRFRFRDQVKDNMFHTLFWAVPVITAYEVITYWAFANGYLGFIDPGTNPVLFWGWFVVLLLVAPVIHSIHFYLGHRLLHVKFLYRSIHSLHHNNVDVGPWSGLSMHPVEHILYFSTVVVQWLLALHPVNALFQIHLAAFLPALSHSGFERLRIGKKLTLDGGSPFHYLHHKYFECNYGGSLTPLDGLFGTFHDGTDASHAAMRQRMRSRREAMN